jgi:acyl carrier protein
MLEEWMDTYSQLTPIFRDVFDDDQLTLAPAMTADDVEGWDSLSHIRLIISVEQAFAVTFSAAEVGALKDVADFVALIESKHDGQARS